MNVGINHNVFPSQLQFFLKLEQLYRGFVTTGINKCGIAYKHFISTIFGSIKHQVLTSCGLAFNKILVIIPFIQTDLPLPSILPPIVWHFI